MSWYLLLLMLLSKQVDSTRNCTGIKFTFKPPEVKSLLIGRSVNVTLKVTRQLMTSEDVLLRVKMLHNAIAEPDEHSFVFASKENLSTFPITITGRFIGRTEMHVFSNKTLHNSQSKPVFSNTIWHQIPNVQLPVTVTRREVPLVQITRLVLLILVLFANLGMGCKVDLDIVRSALKRPVAPAIGLLSQFIAMPLISLAAGQIFNFDRAIAFGLLTLGCAPGGGASNMFTFLLDGNVSLSITMTLISTFAALGLMPLWLFTLGAMFVYKKRSFKIPYGRIFLAMGAVLIPVCIGIAIKYKKPKWARIMLRVMLPIVIVLIFTMMIIGTVSNMYIFKLFRPKIVVAGALLPYGGFFIGGTLATIFRQSWADIKTIAIETGIQNLGITMVVLLSLPAPDKDIAIVGPLVAGLFIIIALWTTVGIRLLYYKVILRFFKSEQPIDNHDDADIKDNFLQDESVSPNDVQLYSFN